MMFKRQRGSLVLRGSEGYIPNWLENKLQEDRKPLDSCVKYV